MTRIELGDYTVEGLNLLGDMDEPDTVNLVTEEELLYGAGYQRITFGVPTWVLDDGEIAILRNLSLGEGEKKKVRIFLEVEE